MKCVNRYETVIVGGGIAGLACARSLRDHDVPFALVSPDLGGRITTSCDGRINYGAYFVGSDYRHVLQYVERRRRLSPFRVRFYSPQGAYRITRALRYPSQGTSFLRLMQEFRLRYARLKRRCHVLSQKDALDQDAFLSRLYRQPACQLIEEAGFGDLATSILDPGLLACTFCPREILTAFDYLRLSQYSLIPVYEFTFVRERLIQGFEQDIIMDAICQIERDEDGYRLHTERGRELLAHRLVLATPIHVSARLWPLPRIKQAVNTYMTHVTGRIRPAWCGGDEELFPAVSNVCVVARQRDRSYLVYGAQPEIDLAEYFSQYQILARRDWVPAFHLGGSELLACCQDEDLYVIGDHNICGLEDSFITGLYAARCLYSPSGVKTENRS